MKEGINEMDPLVSVIIPVFNVAPYLREALDSAVHQTYSNLQILVIDDGSTDGSGSICDEYTRDPRVTVIHQGNRGLSAARNAGLDRAEGEYIAFLDSDDAYHPDFIRCLAELMSQDNPDIAMCRFGEYCSTGRLGEGKQQRTGALQKQGIYSRTEALQALADGGINHSVWNKLYRSGLWKGIRFPDGHNYEDIDTTYRVLDLCSSISVNEQVLFFYRGRPGSISRTASRKNLEDWKRACLNLEEYVRANSPGVFNEKQLTKARESYLSGLFSFYLRGMDNAEEIIAAGRETGLIGFSFRIKVAYSMIRFCPWLLKKLYPVYLPARKFILRMSGR